jgi:hypothetical protein
LNIQVCICEKRCDELAGVGQHLEGATGYRAAGAGVPGHTPCRHDAQTWTTKSAPPEPLYELYQAAPPEYRILLLAALLSISKRVYRNIDEIEQEIVAQVREHGPRRSSASPPSKPRQPLGDAVCVGASTPATLHMLGIVPLNIQAMEWHSRQMCRTDAYGFPDKASQEPFKASIIGIASRCIGATATPIEKDRPPFDESLHPA